MDRRDYVVLADSEAPPAENSQAMVAAAGAAQPAVAQQGPVLSKAAPGAAATAKLQLRGGATLSSAASVTRQTTAATNVAAFGLGDVPSEYTVARNARTLGPRLFTRSRPRPLFNVRCNGENIFGDNVRVIGFRLQGPHWDSDEGDDNLE